MEGDVDVDDRGRRSAISRGTLLERRLDEMGLTKHGNRLERWSRF